MTNRNINLKNFLPIAMDGGEMSDFIGVFQDFLNTAYSHPSSSSILDSIENITTLQDAYEVPAEYFTLLASNLGGYEAPKYSKLQEYFAAIGTPTSAIDSNVNEVIRQYLSNLSRIYSIKTNNITITFLVGLFGIKSNVYTLWTNDYQNKWIPVRTKTSVIGDSNINEIVPQNQEYYASPHFTILFDGSDGNYELFTIIAQTISELVNKYRPANTVFDGFGVIEEFSVDDSNDGIFNISGQYTNGIHTIGISSEYI